MRFRLARQETHLEKLYPAKLLKPGTLEEQSNTNAPGFLFGCSENHLGFCLAAHNFA